MTEPAGHPRVFPFVQSSEALCAHRRMFRKVTTMIRKFIYATMMGGLLLGATACNTVKGAGKDLQSAADTTEEAIN